VADFCWYLLGREVCQVRNQGDQLTEAVPS
jgi:hypothetical protein